MEAIMNEQKESSPLLKHRREIIAFVVGIVILVVTTQFLGGVGFGSAIVTLVAAFMTPVIIYPIPSRRKVLFAILPHIIACLLLLFRLNMERPLDMLWAWLGILLPGVVVASIMYLLDRSFGKKGVGIFIVAAFVGLGIYLIM